MVSFESLFLSLDSVNGGFIVRFSFFFSPLCLRYVQENGCSWHSFDVILLSRVISNSIKWFLKFCKIVDLILSARVTC